MCLHQTEAVMNDATENDLSGGGRGPAYPFISLEKAVDRVQRVFDTGLSRQAFAPISFYKAWGYEKESGNARQTMAALNYFGLLEYKGRGKDRKAELTRLARRIILDKVPNSPERLAALREAALMPPAYRKLFEQFGPDLVPDYAMETFLTMELEYTPSGARNVISGYRDTFSYAGLGEIDTLTPNEPADQPDASWKPEIADAIGKPAKEPGMTPHQTAAHTTQAGPLPSGAETDIKVMLDGAFLRISAVVDAKGAKKLMRVLTANIALLEDDDDDGPETPVCSN